MDKQVRGKQEAVERQTLWVGCLANLLMANAGWLAFYYSSSQALLLDGNFSFILCLTGMVTLLIKLYKANLQSNSRFDQLYVLIKSSLVTLVVLCAVVASLNRIYQYLSGQSMTMINTEVIAYYIVFVVLICLLLFAYYERQNAQVGHGSEILKAESMSAVVDALMSSSAGLVLMMINLVEKRSALSFLLYIGDALAVLLLAMFILTTPLKLAAQALIHLLDDKKEGG